MKLSDFKGLFKTAKLTLLTSENPYDDYYVFDFEIKEDMKWDPGDHGIFTIPGKRIPGWGFRAFSVASIPDEGILKIGTRISNSPSSFKQALRMINPGEKISIRGPFGWFKLQDETIPIVMVAGGIGITPFRALMKEMEKGNNRHATLIHSARAYHLFKEEIESITEKDDKIKTHFVNHREDVYTLLEDELKLHGSDAYYYLSGSQEMIKDLRGKIKSKHVPGGRTIVDQFRGYS